MAFPDSQRCVSLGSRSCDARVNSRESLRVGKQVEVNEVVINELIIAYAVVGVSIMLIIYLIYMELRKRLFLKCFFPHIIN